MFKAVQNSLLALIYPQQCLVCSRHADELNDGVACPECWSATHIFDGSEMLCQKCGAFLGNSAAAVPIYCHKCDDHFYDRAVAVGVYEKALAASIIHLKTSPFLPGRLIPAVSNVLGRPDLATVDMVIPIPLSKQRELERGFNQAEIIAQAAARFIAAPIDRMSLVRTLHTPIHRIGMDRRAREMTVRNAFQVVRPKLVSGKNILLVDDVFTSGATASSCSQILKKAGANQVSVFTLARAVMH